MFNILYFFILILCVTVLEGVKFRCDYKYHMALGWFKYHNIPATWADARFMCQFEGGMLASPTTSMIKSAMLTSSQGYDIFTGIHSTLSPGIFYTIDGIPLSKISHTWEESEPNNWENAERCTTLNVFGNLSDVVCNQPRPYVCYRKHSYLETTVCGTPDPEYHLDIRTSKCYKFHTTLRKFERAHFACSAEGGHLAIINSEEESKVLKELLNYYAKGINETKRTAFVGFHNWGEDGERTTVHGQSLQEAGFAKFHEETSITGKHCGSVLSSGLLSVSSCEEPSPFICEKDTYYPPVCDTEDIKL